MSPEFIVNFHDGTPYSPQEWIKRYNMIHPLKIRASKAGLLMTEPKSASDKKEGNLSEGAKTYIRELWIAKTYGRRKDITNKFIEKGLLNEELGIDLISIYFNEAFEKNTNLYADDYFTGEPDMLPEQDEWKDFVFDNKCSYSIWTFADSELTPIYYWQLMVYLHLTKRKRGKLIYTLTNSPEATIQRELKKAKWDLQVDDVSELEAKLRKEMNYDDIPDSERVRIFDVEYSEAEIERLKQKVIKAREYYATLSLTPKQLIES